MENDIVFLNDQMRLCGFSVGSDMSRDEEIEYCAKNHLHMGTWKQYKMYWGEWED